MMEYFTWGLLKENNVQVSMNGITIFFQFGHVALQDYYTICSCKLFGELFYFR